MLLDWLKLTSWLRALGMTDREIAGEITRNLPRSRYFVDSATHGPERRARSVHRPARSFDTHETCERCGLIFDQANTSDIELVTGLCQTCWGNRVQRAHNRGATQ